MRWVLFIAILFFFSCGERMKKEEVPANLITSEAMVPLLVDLQLIEGANTTKHFLGDTGQANYELLYKTIFEKHSVRKTQFDSAMAYYTLNGDQLETIYDQVIEELMKMEAEQTAKE